MDEEVIINENEGGDENMTNGVNLGDILNNIFEAIKIVVNKIAEVIKDNAETIGTLLILGAITNAVISYGRSIFRQISVFVRGFM